MKKMWLREIRVREIRVGLIEPEVRSSFSGSHLSCSSMCRTGDVVQHVGGEILNEFANGVFERSPLHLSLYLLLFKRKIIQTRTLPVLKYRGDKFYWGKVHEMLKCLSFFLLLFSLYNFYFIFIIVNWAWWVTLQGEEMNKDAQGM